MHNFSWHRWLTPVIPVTQEAEIRRIEVQSQPWANNPRDPISSQERADGVAQGEGPEFKFQYHKINK
jgi:hypothetical protein